MSSAPLPGPLPETLLRRFRPTRELGSGGCGTVYLVDDLVEPPSPKAIKIVARPGSDPRRVFLRHEFDVLRRLRHPGLVRVFDFGDDKAARLLWFTSEFVPGLDLYSASAGWSPTQLEAALSALVETLGFLHEREVLHNDIKPSNVRVPGAPPSVRLLDFGLASSLVAGPGTAGTPPYMAPERLRGRSAGSVRADLYSLGVVFYRCAVRRLPFEGEDAAAVLGSLGTGPVAPRILRPDLPHFLEEVLLRLLSPEPADRHGSAAELLEDIGRSGRRRSTPSTPSVLPGPPLLDRDTLVAELMRGARRVFAGAGAAPVLLVSEAGIGKSRILEELRQSLELEGCAVVSVRGQPGPPRAWSLVGDIVRRLAALPVLPPLPPRLAALVAPLADRGTEALVEVRETFAAHVMACARTAPLALLVDDLAQGDEQSVAAIVSLAGASARSPDAARMAVFAATREGAEAGPIGDRWTSATGAPALRLEPLAAEAQRALLSSLFPGGEIPEAMLSEAIRAASGNPLALEEIARAWVDAGAARKVGGSYRFSAEGAVPQRGPPRDLIAGRLLALDGVGARIVRLVALHGAPLSAMALASLVPDLPARLEELERSGFLAGTPDGIDVRHPLVREAALADLREEGARPLHLALGEALERAGASAEDVWRHLLRGGALERGLMHALSAGLHAEAVQDYTAAKAILNEARDTDKTRPDLLAEPDRLRLWQSLAVCLDETGEHAEGAALMERVMERAPPSQAPALGAKLGRMLYRSGATERARVVLHEAVATGNEPRALIEAATWHANVLHALRRYSEAHETCVRHIPIAGQLEQEGRDLDLVARFYSASAVKAQLVVGVEAAIASVKAALRVADSGGLAGARSLARTTLACMLTDSGDLPAALRTFAEAEAGLSTGDRPVAWVDHRRLRARAWHFQGQSRQALSLLDIAPGLSAPNQRTMILAQAAQILADIGDPTAGERVCDLFREIDAGLPDGGAVLELIEAGLRAALWSGQTGDLDDLDRRLAAIGQAGVVGYDLGAFHGARAVAALLRSDPEKAVASLCEAKASAERFLPVLIPAFDFHLGYALELCGRHDDALAAATRAEEGHLRVGNQGETARARALGQAIAARRIGSRIEGADWFRRAVAATARGALAADAPRALAEAVARTTEATACWLFAGPTAEPRLLSAAGPCGGADPVAWSGAIERALDDAEPTRRPGIGLALAIDMAGERWVLVVEDRAWPQAFSAEAAGAAEMVVARALDVLECRRLGADLDLARHALEDAATRPSPRPREAATVATAQTKATRSRTFDPTVGSVVLRHAFEGIVGRSKPMRRALQVIDRAVALDINVLVIGETGTGKELVARALHEQGPRASGPFVAVNCAAVPRTLAESEFFGHVPGAFTGAGRARHRGYFEQASGGTLLLDEVAELEPPMQAKLLRALEEREVRPLGSDRTIPVDLRIVAATARDLHEEVSEGRFRSDLLFRLAVIEVRLPPLRERADDIPVLAKHLLTEIAETPPSISPDALDALCAYPWPGNVRELQNQLERATAFCTDGVIRLEHLAAGVRQSGSPGASAVAGTGRTLRQALDAVERRLVGDALRATGGRKLAAARALGVTPTGLTLKMRRLGLAPKRPSRR